MAKLNEGSDNSLKEEALDEEDELDGWGPVRVRRSTVPAPPAHPLCAKAEEPAAQDAQAKPKRLMT
jgi:hypothetical protein